MSTTRRLIDRVKTRLLVVGAIEDLSRALPWAAGAAVAGLAADRFLSAPTAPWTAAWAGAAVIVGFPLCRALLRRHDDRALAAEADQRLGLAERISTAVWIEKAKPADPAGFTSLVLADAEIAASGVGDAEIRRAIRPRHLRRPLLAALGVAALATAFLIPTERADAVVESDADRIARLADADRTAEVARKIREEAKRVEAEAEARKETELANLADEVRKKLEPLTRAPAPARDESMRRMNAIADLAAERTRRRALGADLLDVEKAAAADRMLDDLLEELTKANVESLPKELAELERKLKDAKDRNELSSSDMRDIANRVDSLRKAMQRAASAEGDSALLRQLRSMGNEELLSKISERMREIAARMDRGEPYEGLESETGESEEMDLSEMSEEELQQLLKELDQLAGMKDLEKMLRQGNGELAGGRKLRLGGSGGT